MFTKNIILGVPDLLAPGVETDHLQTGKELLTLGTEVPAAVMTDGQGHQTEKTIDLGQRTGRSRGNGQMNEKMPGVGLKTERNQGLVHLIERKAECGHLTAKTPENGRLNARNQATECLTERTAEELHLLIIQAHVKELVRKEIIGR